MFMCLKYKGFTSIGVFTSAVMLCMKILRIRIMYSNCTSLKHFLFHSETSYNLAPLSVYGYLYIYGNFKDAKICRMYVP